MIRFIFLYFLFLWGVFSQQAWAPYERQLWVRPVFTHSEYTSAFLAGSKASYDDNVRINAGLLALEYGITDRLTVDTTVGFGKLGRHKIFNRYAGLLQTPESPDKYGTLDSRLGIRYKIIDEYDSNRKWMPTISIRVGGIKKGDYDRNPQSLGDGANGGEVSLYFAKDFNLWGMGTLGEFTYRDRQKPVPNDILYYAALYKRIGESFFLTLGGRGQKGQSGYAFADPRQQPPFNYFTFPTVEYLGVDLFNTYVTNYRPAWGRREDFHNAEFSIGFSDSYGNFYNIFFSKTLDGYNTAELRTVGFVVNMPFNL